MTICQGCGHNDDGPVSDQPPTANHCGHCPPWQCDACGGMCSATMLCGCWISLEGMALADIKATLARADLSVG